MLTTQDRAPIDMWNERAPDRDGVLRMRELLLLGDPTLTLAPVLHLTPKEADDLASLLERRYLGKDR